MYENDYDDTFVLTSQNLLEDGCPSAVKHDPHCFDNAKEPSLDWPLLLFPYVTSAQVFINSDTGDPQGYFSNKALMLSIEGNSKAKYCNVAAQFGYNYPFLSPIQVGFPTGAGGWQTDPKKVSPGYGSVGRVRSAAVHPEKTVLFVSAQNFATYDNAAKQYTTPDCDFTTPPGVYGALFWSSKRLLITGDSGPKGNDSNYYLAWEKKSPRGEFTADVRVVKPKVGAYVAWLDGHVSINTADKLAQGTDFETSAPSNPADYKNGKYMGCDITDIDKYLWSLDGTVRDVR